MSPEAYLHAARLSSGLSLHDIAERTRLSPRVVRALDEGRFDDLPGGLYARSYVRAFASTVAADPETVEHQLIPLLPDVDDPVSAVRGALTVAPTESDERRHAGGILAAASLDAVLLMMLNGGLTGAVAAACGLTSGQLLAHHGLAFSAVCSLATVSYFVLFGGIDGRTPGRRLGGLPRLETSGPLRAGHILRRAARIYLEEVSLVLTWLQPPPSAASRADP
jgi:hypothetical protein